MRSWHKADMCIEIARFLFNTASNKPHGTNRAGQVTTKGATKLDVVTPLDIAGPLCRNYVL